MTNSRKPATELTLADVLAYAESFAATTPAQEDRIIAAIDALAEGHAEDQLRAAFTALDDAMVGDKRRAFIVADAINNAELLHRDTAIRLAYRVGFEAGFNDGTVAHTRRGLAN